MSAQWQASQKFNIFRKMYRQSLSIQILSLRNIALPTPPIAPLFTPTYLRPNSSDHRPVISVCLVWGRGCCCYQYPLAHLRLLCCLCPVFPHQRGRLSQHIILRRSCEPVCMGSDLFCYLHSCSSVLHSIPDHCLR